MKKLCPGIVFISILVMCKSPSETSTPDYIGHWTARYWDSSGAAWTDSGEVNLIIASNGTWSVSHSSDTGNVTWGYDGPYSVPLPGVIYFTYTYQTIQPEVHYEYSVSIDSLEIGQMLYGIDLITNHDQMTKFWRR